MPPSLVRQSICCSVVRIGHTVRSEICARASRAERTRVVFHKFGLIHQELAYPRSIIMLLRAISTGVFLVTVTVNAFAQDTGVAVELGMLTGASIQSTDDGDLTTIALPGASLALTGSLPAIYLSVFPSGNLSFGGEFGLGRVSEDGESITNFLVGGQVTYSISGNNSRHGLYMSGLGTYFDLEGEIKQKGVGVGVGNKFRLGETDLSLRMEVRYKRIFDDYDGANEFSFLIGFGGRLGG